MSGITIQLTPAAAVVPQQVQTTHMPRGTAYDVIEHLLDILGADAQEVNLRKCRRALLDAMREFTTAFKWQYLLSVGRIQLHGSYNTGTAQYLYSSGAYPRQLTLTPDPVEGGAWPPWSGLGYVRIGNIVSKVGAFVSPTVITLQDPYDYGHDILVTSAVNSLPAGNTVAGATNASPIVILAYGHGFNTGDTVTISGVLGNTAANGTWVVTVLDGNGFSLNGSAGNGAWAGGGTCAEGTAGVQFKLFFDTYTLPADFANGDNTLAETIWGTMEYIPPAQWLSWVRFRESFGVPRWYTIMGDPNLPGRMCVRIYPFPDSDGTMDFLYTRRPRPVQTIELSQYLGKQLTASGNPGVNATRLTLSQGVLGPQHVGSVIRLSVDGTNAPDGTDGLNPYLFEANVVAVTSPTQCQVDVTLPQTFAGNAVRISDPIDVEDLAMWVAVKCCAEKHLTRVMCHKLAGRFESAYNRQLVLAKEADARIAARRAAGVGGQYRPRMAFMPRGPDIS